MEGNENVKAGIVMDWSGIYTKQVVWYMYKYGHITKGGRQNGGNYLRQKEMCCGEKSQRDIFSIQCCGIKIRIRIQGGRKSRKIRNLKKTYTKLVKNTKMGQLFVPCIVFQIFKTFIMLSCTY